ncbi:unnamed protein product [Adineta steineri]|uniref:Uncharacterized protein n=1 Tax=Adineta steineri TaxID=433720 RepID=A0A819R893_9BILA|nr:unnamed protein product [Adineta steineri]CAF4023044.1 unnamed protein product [Adineta steineri]CAF4040385.1 unnamed protein product [Adineta steineri]
MSIMDENQRNAQLENEINKYDLHSKIDLSFHQLTDYDMNIVIKQAIIEKQCKTLLLNDNLISSEGATIIANALNNNKTLEELNLWNNKISDDGVSALARVLSNNNETLRSLALGQNQISDIGIQHLAEMLKTNQTISRLWLFSNEITDNGVKILADVLVHNNQNLQWLDLRLNKLMTDLCFDSIHNILKYNRTLKKFWMEYCNLSWQIKAKIREIAHNKEDFNFGA